VSLSPLQVGWAQAEVRLSKIPPFPGAGHSTALQKPPGPCRSFQQGQAGCKEASELGRAQELSTAQARVQVSGASGCSNLVPRCCSREDGGQVGVWGTTHLRDTTSEHLMSFMQIVNLFRFSCGAFSHSMEGCALEVTCSGFAVAEARKQCSGAGGPWSGTQLPTHQRA